MERVIMEGEVSLTVKGSPSGDAPPNVDTVFVYSDFDITAVESLGEMWNMYKDSRPDRAQRVRKAIEKALGCPRVGKKAAEILGISSAP